MLHDGNAGYGRVLVGVPCVTSHVTPLCWRSLGRLAANWNWEVLVELELVGTVAVGGVKVTVIPESRVRVAVPVLWVFAAEVAVMVMSSEQSCDDALQLVPARVVRLGTWPGATKVTVVLVELAGILPVEALHVWAELVCAVPEEST